MSPRVIDSGHYIRFQNKYYKLMDQRGLPVYYYSGTKGLVIQTFTEELLFSTQEKVYVLDEIPKQEKKSKNFDLEAVKEEPQKRQIPSPKHPWKTCEFLKHLPYDFVSKKMLYA